MVTVIQGTTNKPVSAQRLAGFFVNHSEYDGFLYVGYPIIGTAEGPYPIDALLVSPQKGLIIFCLVENQNTSDIEGIQDDSFNKLDSKLRAHKELMDGRELRIPIRPVTFAPVYHTDVINASMRDYPVCNEENLKEWLDILTWETPVYYEKLVSVLQAISTIRKGRKKRDVQKTDSLGAKLKKLEDSVANLDNLQGQAVIETVDGVQRIRGLAGSGKTIVLALKAAYLHAQHPDWKIAVTFNTRSLKGQFHHLINTFSIEQTNEEPDWDNLHIINAWGAPGGGDRNGMYYNFCRENKIEYNDFNTAKIKFGKNNEFENVCIKALEDCINPTGVYDAILIDEAQDFFPAFLQLCYKMLKDKKRLVYAYDELQNLNSKSLPPPEEIFGKNADGTPKVRLSNHQGMPQQDIILEKCYRNSRPILATAHALGFGIYRMPPKDSLTGLVQMFENSQLWCDVGYEVINGNLSDGQTVVLSRSDKTSPLFLENHSPIDDLIQFHCFNTQEEQNSWVVGEIFKNLKNDELRADDIIVINPNPLTTRDAVGSIRSKLLEYKINSHLAGVDSSADIFFDTDSDSVTFTGIYRAKGNEAGMVYIINAQDCYSSWGNMATVRNRLFTAITRSKAWVRVLGVGVGMNLLKREFEKIKEENFTLSFRYPTEDERRHINIVHRDMTEEERKKVKKQKGELAELLDALETGKIFPEDLGTDQIERLMKLLDRESK
ncbi:MAG: ATP-binding domain-containing protein [Prevotellaceae bacterium]|jgi:superfamily I DNA and RNA helicase|nr:ATP-binding domain-containing protein [Prevotellaceae bacterium]